MSQRLARLERQGLIERELDPADRRGIVVELTAKGRELVERIADEHLANERRLLEPLSNREQDALAALLKKLLLAYEHEEPVARAKPHHGRADRR
jgi:DNA-binding MarR family transcriptional regulator